MRFSALIPFTLILSLEVLATPLPFLQEFQGPLQDSHNSISQSINSANQSLSSLGDAIINITPENATLRNNMLGNNKAASNLLDGVDQLFTKMKTAFANNQDADKSEYAHTLDC
jgi:hypothetical protein